MQELPDDDQAHEGLDGLFRKSAEEFEPNFDSAAWSDMQNRLDEHDRKVLVNKWLTRSLIALVVLLMGVGSWYSWQVLNAGGASVRQLSGRPTRTQSGQVTKETGKLATPVDNQQPTGNKANATKADSQKETSVNETTSTPVLGEVNREEQSLAESTTKERTDVGQRKANSPINRAPATTSPQSIAASVNLPARSAIRETKGTRIAVVGNKQAPLSAKSTRLATNSAVAVDEVTRRPDNTVIKDQERTAMAVMESTNEAKASRQKNANPDYVDEPASLPLLATGDPEGLTGGERLVLDVDQLQSRSFVWPVFTPIQTDQIVVSDTAPRLKKTPYRVRGLSLRAIVAPDLTTIGLRDFVRPGTNLGLMLEYRFSNRWSVQAGGMWSKKVYEAYPEQYNWPSYWKWAVPVESVNGTCSMVDIPVNIRYDFLLRPRQPGLPARWFVSGGVTSYVMLREIYNYVYANPNDPRIKFRKWDGNSGRYGFSHLNVSVGYERALTRRWAWQVEPFLKMPLQRVGYFKINLISTGAFLSLRYKL